MKTTFDFQYLTNGAARPADDGEIALIDSATAEGSIIAPNVGDFVQLVGAKEDHRRYAGKVKSRLFSYILRDEVLHCHINIVVEPADDVDWGLLIKE